MLTRAQRCCQSTERQRFGAKSEIVSHLPAGAVLELSVPSAPNELVERVIAGQVPSSPSAIRRQKNTERTDERSYAVGGTLIDYLMRFKGDREDFAAGAAAHMIRRWRDPEHRAWFARFMRTVAEMIDGPTWRLGCLCSNCLGRR
jgi:hypothetical protein